MILFHPRRMVARGRLERNLRPHRKDFQALRRERWAMRILMIRKRRCLTNKNQKAMSAIVTMISIRVIVDLTQTQEIPVSTWTEMRMMSKNFTHRFYQRRIKQRA
jgi:hypothetical protein